MTSWSAKQYSAFENERTRPVRDLVAALPNENVGLAVDLGCGPANSTEVLAARYPDAELIGMDNSEDMIEAARKRLPGLRFELADIAAWNPPESYDVILANAHPIVRIATDEGIVGWGECFRRARLICKPAIAQLFRLC